MPPTTDRAVCELDHRISQINNRTAALGLHPEPLALTFGLQRSRAPRRRTPDLQAAEPVHQHCYAAKIRVRGRLDFRHFRVGARGSTREAHEVAGLVLESVAVCEVGGVDAKTCREEGEDVQACGVGGAHVGVDKGLVGHDEVGPLAGHFGGLRGGEGEVVFGDVEELGRVFCAGLVGYGGADAFVAGI